MEEEIRAKAKKWGSSIGIIIPKEIVEAKKIKENDEILIEIKNRPLAGEFFGRFPRKSKKTAQEIKDEMKRGWN
ncbi:MAG: AbrB/MazE/SpoVT family DNA-binding domain-containing protein [Nanoarchaeota archaeon]